MQSLLKEAGFLAETDKMILKFLWKFKESRIAKQSQKKKKRRTKLVDSHYLISKFITKLQ